MTREILKTAYDFLKEYPVKPKGLTKYLLYIKTPNIFYKTRRVYLKMNHSEAFDITESLKEKPYGSTNLTAFYDMMAIVYHQYFGINKTTFKDEYYVIAIVKTEEGEWGDPRTYGSKSPDLQDAEGTVIR